MKIHWVDRLTAPLAPAWTLRRQQARIASDVFIRHYEGASVGRRTRGWRRGSGDANAVIGPALHLLRASARDLVRNNPYAESALSTIADHTVGWGIVAKPKTANKRVQDEWTRWAESTDCDADGRHDLYGLQKLVMRTIVESGEVVIRRRFRLPSDGFRVPLQIQVLDPDFIDTARDNSVLPEGGATVIQGVAFTPIGQRAGYYLFSQHPGASMGGFAASKFVPAESVRHAFKALRPGQVRGPSWFAPVLLRFKDFDEFEDATLMKQKIAACLAVLLTDVDGTSPAVGNLDTARPTEDYIEPGLIKSIAPGQSVQIVSPPPAGDYGEYSKNVLRAIATGLGVTHEDLTGNYDDMPFSAARMSRLRHAARVYDWRYRVLIPQFCDPVWDWFIQAATVQGLVPDGVGPAVWTPPPLESVDPEKEGTANNRLVRNAFKSWSETIRESGQDPDEVAAEIKADYDRWDRLGIVVDCDPRKLSQQGQVQTDPKKVADERHAS